MSLFSLFHWSSSLSCRSLRRSLVSLCCYFFGSNQILLQLEPRTSDSVQTLSASHVTIPGPVQWSNLRTCKLEKLQVGHSTAWPWLTCEMVSLLAKHQAHSSLGWFRWNSEIIFCNKTFLGKLNGYQLFEKKGTRLKELVDSNRFANFIKLCPEVDKSTKRLRIKIFFSQKILIKKIWNDFCGCRNFLFELNFFVLATFLLLKCWKSFWKEIKAFFFTCM